MEILNVLGSLLDIAERVITIILLIATLLWFAFQTWIVEYIKNRFSRAVSSQLEDQKHQLNKELEEYKGSLLRQLEEFRSDIDIRRSVALKLADARLDALRVLAADIDHAIGLAASFCVSDLGVRRLVNDEYFAACDKANAAIRRAQIFLPLKLNGEIATAIRKAVQLVRDCRASNNILKSDNEEIEALAKSSASIALALRNELVADPWLPRRST